MRFPFTMHASYIQVRLHSKLSRIKGKIKKNSLHLKFCRCSVSKQSVPTFCDIFPADCLAFC